MSVSVSAIDDELFVQQLRDMSPAGKWPQVRNRLKTDPLPFFRELRSRCPVLVTDECVLLSRYEDVINALSQPTIFSVELYKPKMGSYLMTEDETPRHNDDKRIMRSLLKREDLPAIRAFVANAANTILAASPGKLDIVDNYSRMVPALMVQGIFGLDGRNPEKMIAWSYWNQYSAFRNQHFHVAADSKSVERTKLFHNILGGFYMLRLLLRKSWKLKYGKPDDDTVTRLLQENFPKHGSWEIYRKGINSGGLLIGAVETTSEAVAHILSELHKRPQYWDMAADLATVDDTDAFDKLCWEALRHRPIAPYIIRKMSQDHTFRTVGGDTVELAKGQTVLCLIASAMFDEAAVEFPELFNPTREFGISFHFGYEHHACLGREIGRVMIPELVRQLFLQKNLALESDIDYAGDPFPKHMNLSWETGR